MLDSPTPGIILAAETEGAPGDRKAWLADRKENVMGFWWYILLVVLVILIVVYVIIKKKQKEG